MSSPRVLPLVWQLARLPDPAQPPKPGDWIAAVVPGAVQSDWARAHDWPPHWQGNNFRAYAGLEDSYWLYRTQLTPVPRGADTVLIFSCAGVDYACDVRLGGRTLLSQEGMFTPIEIDLTAAGVQPGDWLEILVHPAPKRAGAADDRHQASASCKPAVSYGWDFHPRLIPLGIWGETQLEVRPRAHLREAELRYELTDDCTSAALTLSLQSTAAAGATVRWTLCDPAGATVATQDLRVGADGSARATAILADPALWWPHDHGSQPLYHSTFTLLATDGQPASTLIRRTGFRRVRLVPYAGMWEDDFGPLPNTRPPPPITVEINGRRIFARGSNWVGPDIFPGTVTADRHLELLRLARDAHFNLLRCWGGAPAQAESFYNYADELGLLIWQEFPLACSSYPDDPAYLATLDRESRSLLLRLRRHPSLALWCGGNELFCAWSRMDDQSHALRLLDHNCFELDRCTPFLASSPLTGMVHGDYRFRVPGNREVYQLFLGRQATAYTEFGVPGPAPLAALPKFIPPDELFPPRFGTAWETHHGLGAWETDMTTWLCLSILEHYFGPADDLATLIARGEWLQGEGYKALYEEARRQKPRAAMALSWCFNEPWPCAANNSLLHWPATPKAGYIGAQAACRPVMASARLPKFSWVPGEDFSLELFLLNDSPAVVPAGTITVTLEIGDRLLPLGQWAHPAAAADQHLAGPTYAVSLPPDVYADRFTVRLTAVGHPERDSAYVLHYRPSVAMR